ncbi:MAG TPA: hypothetical protein VKU02_24070 [Gemmataceae bacterium]|nr:hypothetical protein [Gemmataceae bacterium]
MALLATRTSRPKSKAKQRFFSITFHIEGTEYRISPLAIDPSIGHKAFRFAKQGGDEAVYDVHVDAHGTHCQCLGFLRHGHCKHADTIRAAEQVFRLS